MADANAGLAVGHPRHKKKKELNSKERACAVTGLYYLMKDNALSRVRKPELPATLEFRGSQ